MGTTTETRITSTQAKDAIYKAHSISSSASEIDDVSNTYYKKANLSLGRNLFNINETDNIADKFVNSSNGELLSSTSYKTTGFIRIDKATTYTMSYKHAIAWYDKDKVFISGSASTDTNKTQTSPSRARYVRCTVQNANWTFFQFEKGSMQTSFIDYVLPYVELGYKIDPTNTVMFERTQNLFDKTTAKVGYFINWTNGTYSSNALYCASSFIEIKPSTSYTMSNYGNINYLAWFDANYVFISGNQTDLFPMTSPSNAKYLKVTVTTATLETAQLEEGTVATAYNNPYRLKSFYGQKSISNWYGKKWATLGDSITAGMTWQSIAVTSHNLLLVNGGVGGSKISGTSTDSFAEGTRVNAMPSDADLISVMGGTNDWAQDTPLGIISDTGTTTFYGALNTLMSLLFAKFPAKRIFLMTTPYGEMLDYATRGWANKITNTQGLTTYDYATAIKQICIKYKVPYIDVHNEAGWNSINITNYITNDGNLLHPNSIGGSVIGRMVSDAINKY